MCSGSLVVLQLVQPLAAAASVALVILSIKLPTLVNYFMRSLCTVLSTPRGVAHPVNSN